MLARTRRLKDLAPVWIAAVCATWTIALSGCKGGSDPTPDASAAADEKSGSASGVLLTADEVLQRMLAAYRSAPGYQDQGVFRAVLRRGEETTEDSAPMAVAFARPNRLAVRAYQAALVCNGQRLQAKIFDEFSRDLDGQIVDRVQPQALTLDHLFSDGVLRESLGGRLGLHPPQLELLLAENPFQALVEPQVRKHLLMQKEFDGRTCYRVEVNLRGRYVFWIDRESYILRRMDYPGDALLTREEAEDAELSISAEFPQAQFVAAPGDRFTLKTFGVEIPDDAKLVRFFVVPPQPLPTEMYGKRPEAFEFVGLDGEKVTPKSLAGKVAVFVWFTDHPGSRACLQALEGVRTELASDEQIVFYAVCTEPSTRGNDELRKIAKEWDIDATIVRDLGAYGRDVFGVQVAPSLVVLDSKGAVQIHETGESPQLAAVVQEQLTDLLKRLAGGEDFAAAILTQARADQEAYQLNLNAAQGALDVELTEPAEIAAPSKPQHLSLSPLWSTDEFEHPGNMLAFVEGDSSRILVMDGGRAVAEMDASGKLLRRVDLDLPPEVEVNYLRTAVDRKGKRFYAAFALLGSQVHVFDEDWRRVISYPAADQQHDGIRDALLADLNDSGTPGLLVGFWGLTGVHGANLSGERAWSNRQVAPVLSLAVTPQDAAGWRKALITGNEGHLLRVNQYGNADPPIHVKQRMIHQIVAAPWPEDRPTAYLGLSFAPEGNLVAIGLNAEFAETWSYRLPKGAYGNPIQYAIPCRVLDGDAGQWLLAGPDGSLHLVSDDGNFFDYFQSGERLSGMCAFRTPEGGVLIHASTGKITAWRVP